MGHTYGPYSSEARTQWSLIKNKVAQLRSSLKHFTKKSGVDVSLHIVSDHGMYEKWFSQMIDLKNYFEFYGFPENIDVELKYGQSFQFKNYTPTAEQVEQLQASFRRQVNLDGEVSYGVTRGSLGLSTSSPQAHCGQQNSEQPYLWSHCRVSGGGHHAFHPVIHQKHFDGIYWKPLEVLPKATYQQTDIVPIVARELNIDISQQKQYPTCFIQNLNSN